MDQEDFNRVISQVSACDGSNTSVEEKYAFVWDFMQRNCVSKLEAVLESNALRHQGLHGDKKTSQVFNASQAIGFYTIVYELIAMMRTDTYGELLYDDYTKTLKRYVSENVCGSLARVEGREFLSEFVHRFENHQLMLHIYFIFNYLDRHHVRMGAKHTIDKLGWFCFTEVVYHQFKEKISEAAVSIVRDSRLLTNEKDKETVKSVVKILHFLSHYTSTNPYKEHFDHAFLADARSFYAEWASVHADLDLATYMLKAEKVIRDELQLAEDFCLVQSREGLDEILRETILYSKQLDRNELHALFTQKRASDLATIYGLYAKRHGDSPGIVVLSEVFERICEEEAEVIYTDVAVAIEEGRQKVERITQPFLIREVQNLKYVDRFLELHKCMRVFVVNCFQSSFYFTNAMKNTLKRVFNRPIGSEPHIHKIEDLLNAHMDRALRQRNVTDFVELEEVLSQSVQLFNLIESKDLFGEIYRENLAKRLLADQPLNEDLEKACVSKFRVDCGQSYTSKLEGMINDALSRSTSDFQNYRRDCGEPEESIEFSLKVLTKSNWPSFPELEIKGPAFRPPDSLSKLLQAYELYYTEANPRKRVTWIYRSSMAAVAFDASDFALGKRVELVVNAHQAAILLLFNHKPAWTVEEIAEATGLDNKNSYVRKLVASLVVQKFKVLKAEKTEANGKPDFNGSFVVNEKATTNERKVKLPAPVLEDMNSINRVEVDRKFQVDAVIVKILKTRQTLDFNNIFIAVNEHVAIFKPSITVRLGRQPYTDVS